MYIKTHHYKLVKMIKFRLFYILSLGVAVIEYLL